MRIILSLNLIWLQIVFLVLLMLYTVLFTCTPLASCVLNICLSKTQKEMKEFGKAALNLRSVQMRFKLIAIKICLHKPLKEVVSSNSQHRNPASSNQAAMNCFPGAGSSNYVLLCVTLNRYILNIVFNSTNTLVC